MERCALRPLPGSLPWLACGFTPGGTALKLVSLSWSQSLFELLPSAVPSSELLWFTFSSSPSFSFLLVWVCFLYFLFVLTMRRSILRWVDRIILSCSLDGVITMLNKQGLCCKKYVLTSALVCICRTKPTVLWFDFWFLLLPDVIVQDISHSRTQIISQLQCCWTPFLFFCVNFGCWEFSSFPCGFFKPTLSALCLKSHNILEAAPAM